MALRPPEQPSPETAESPVQTASEVVGRAYGHLLVPRTSQLEVVLFVYSFGAGGLFFVAALLAARFAPAIGGQAMAAAFAALAVVGIGAWIYFRWEFFTGGTKSDLAAFPSPNHRVWCVGSPAAHARWRSNGPITNAAFEPEVFAAPFALRADRWMQTAWIATALVVYGSLYLLLVVLGTPPSVLFHHIYLFYGSIAAGSLLVAAIRPTSIRIVPGRIDIMRGWFFQSSRPVVRSIPLRDRRVVMDLRSGIVFVMHPTTVWQADATVAFGTPRHKARIAHAILRAAVSTAEPPPLPQDAPIG